MESPQSNRAPVSTASQDHSLSRWFGEEVQPHEPALRGYLRRSFPTVRDVDDVVQESYLRVWKARTTRPIESAKAFLFTVARRLALDFVRRKRRSPFLAVKDFEALFVLTDAPTAAEAADHSEDIQLLVAAIDSLPARCREIFVLCQIEGHPQRLVAERLGLSENTVAVQSARGLQRCEEFVRRRLNTR